MNLTSSSIAQSSIKVHGANQILQNKNTVHLLMFFNFFYHLCVLHPDCKMTNDLIDLFCVLESSQVVIVSPCYMGILVRDSNQLTTIYFCNPA